MGTFRHPVELSAVATGPFVMVQAVVNTGATYSLFSRLLLQKIGITPQEQAEFILADGRRIMRDLAIVTVRLEERVRPSICVVGEEGAEPLLGAVTLESFGLAADPVNRRLVPAPLYLLANFPHFRSYGIINASPRGGAAR